MGVILDSRHVFWMLQLQLHVNLLYCCMEL